MIAFYAQCANILMREALYWIHDGNKNNNKNNTPRNRHPYPLFGRNDGEQFSQYIEHTCIGLHFECD